MEKFLDFLMWAGDKWGIGAIIAVLWAFDRWRWEKLMVKCSDRYIELGQTTANTLAKIQTIILERLPRNHDDRG